MQNDLIEIFHICDNDQKKKKRERSKKKKFQEENSQYHAQSQKFF